MAIVCTLRLNRVRDTIGHTVSSSHDGRLTAQDRLDCIDKLAARWKKRKREYAKIDGL
jgi:hypothetical protein